MEDLKHLGPFFALQVYVDERETDQWRPLRSLLEKEALERRREQMMRHLSAEARIGISQLDPQVAASVMHLGLVARLVSPFLALAALGQLVEIRQSDLHWIPAPGSSFALSVSPDLLERERFHTGEEWAADLVQELVAPLTTAVPGSPSVLWGNVASALNGAVTAVHITRPSLVPAVRMAADQVLAAIPGPARCSGPLGSDEFRRHSCCLIYRIGGASTTAVCNDCVLRDLRVDRT